MTVWSRRTRRTNTRRTPRAPFGPAAAAAVAAIFFAVGAAPLSAAAAEVAVAGEAENDGSNIESVTLKMIDQSTFVEADGTLSLDLLIAPMSKLASAADDYELSVTVYGLLESADQLGGPLTEALNRRQPIPLSSVIGNGSGLIHLDIPVRSGPGDQARLLLPAAGVYPVSVELRTVEGPIAATTTYLVRSAAADATVTSETVPVAVLLTVADDASDGLPFDEVTALLQSHPDVSITVMMHAEMVDWLEAEPVAAAELAAALGGRPVLTTPGVDLDPSALAEIDQTALYVEADHQARNRLEQLGFVVAPDLAVVDAPLTTAGIELLAELGIGSVVMTGAANQGPGDLVAGPTRLRAVTVDEDLSDAIGGGIDGLERTNQVLAGLTLRQDAEPVVIGGSHFGTDPGLAIDALLRGLTGPGPLQAIPVSAVVSQVDGGARIRPAERPQQDLLPISDLLVEVLGRLDTYQAFYLDGGSTPETYRRQVFAGLARRRNPDDRLQALAAINDRFENDLEVIELHEGQPVTLAARSAPIPIVIESAAVGPRNVMLRFDSDKVAVPDDERIVTIEPGTSSIDVQLETRALGISPLEVSVWTPDGTTLLADTRFEIRSTAVPGLGLLITVGAVGLLGAWWILDARKRRMAVTPSERNATAGSGSV